MKNLLKTINYGSILLIVLVLIAYLGVSGDDYQQAINDNEHWCSNVSHGTWYASRDEFERRCN